MKRPLEKKNMFQQMASFENGENSEVIIEAPSLNSRRITSSILIEAPLLDVWSTLTSYNKLSTYIPNLVQSYIVPSPSNTVRIFQEGAQKILGFDFRASLTMDMIEKQDDSEASRAAKIKVLRFLLVDSAMFSSFDGSWTLRTHSRVRTFDQTTKSFYYRYKTQLTYSVYIRPKGPVPVVALEWRIREDVPLNLKAMKVAVEARARLLGVGSASTDETSRMDTVRMMDWAADETLGAYLRD